MKKVVAILLTLMLVVALAACGGGSNNSAPPAADTSSSSEAADTGASEAPAAGGGSLAIVMPNATHGFMANAIQGITDYLAQYAGDYPGVTTQLIVSADVSEQNNQLDNLIAEGIETILLWPHNGDDLRAGAQKVLDAGIKLVVFDRLISDITPTAECDMDNVAYGASSATFLNDYFKDRLANEKIQVLEFRGDNSTASSMRTDGFMATADPNIEIVQSFSTDWQRAKSQEFMETWLTNTPVAEIEALDAISSYDGEVTAGVMQAIQDYKGPADLSGIVAMAGMGSNTDEIKYAAPLQELGMYYHCVYIDAKMVADYAATVGYVVASGQTVPKSIKIGFADVTTDNYEAMLADPTKLVHPVEY